MAKTIDKLDKSVQQTLDMSGYATTNHGTHVTFTSTAPKVAGTAAVGSATTVSRSDHVHPLQTSVSGNAGSATKLATARTITLTGSVTGSVSFDGSANVSMSTTTNHNHSFLESVDTRNTNPNPNTYTSRGITPEFKSASGIGLPNVGKNFAGVLTYQQWSDVSNWSGGKTTQLATIDDGRMYYRKGDGSGWGSWYQFYTTQNKPSLTDIGAAAATHGTHVTYSTSTPLVAGTGAVGSASNVSRGDHVHPAQTTVSGNAGSATKLATARNIVIGNKTNSFNGTANITFTLADIGAAASGHTHNYAGSSSAGGAANSATKLATARTLTIGSTGKTFDGSANVSWTLSEIGAAAASHTHTTINGVYTSNGGAQPPSYVGSGTVRFNMMNKFKGLNGLPTYADCILMDTYTGSDVPYVTGLGILKQSGDPRAFIAVGAKGNTTTWAKETELLTVANYKTHVTPSNIGAAASSHGTHLTIGTGASNAAAGNHTHTLYTRNSVGDIGWGTTSNQSLPTTVSAIAYWNGAYSGTTSNLAYCKHGAFGSIVTKSSSDYAAASHGTHLTIGTGASNAAAGNHTHSYLPLSGGTTTGGIKRSSFPGTWVAAAKDSNSIINSTAGAGTFAPFFSGKTNNGSIVLACYQTGIQGAYLTKANVDANTNTVTKNVTLMNESGGASWPGTVSANSFTEGGTALSSKYATTAQIGTLSSLKTSAKGNLVAAINELFQSAGNAKNRLIEALAAEGIVNSTSDSFDAILNNLLPLVGKAKFVTGSKTCTVECDPAGNPNGTSVIQVATNLGFTPTYLFVKIEIIYLDSVTRFYNTFVTNLEPTTLYFSSISATIKLDNVSASSFKLYFESASYTEAHLTNLTWYALK